MNNNNLFVKLSIALGTLLIISIMININHFVSKSKCKETKTVESMHDTIIKNDFEISIFSDKDVYKTTDKIKIWATLKYIGDKDTIKIWHASSYMIFSITDGKNFNVEGAVNLMLKSSTLEKDKLYHFDYEKSGGFDEDGPSAEFWKNFYQEKDLMLPAGEYTIAVNGAFGLSDDSSANNELICKLKIKVED